MIRHLGHHAHKLFGRPKTRCGDRRPSHVNSGGPLYGLKSGASGEIRTLKHLFLRQAAIPIRARWHWCTGEDLNLRVPLGETGLQPVRFGRAHAPVQTWRKVDESNAHRSSRCPGFQVFRTSCRPFSSTFRMAESTGVEPVRLLRAPLFSRQVPYRPAHSPFNCQRTKEFW
jgi:hypothetical protein